MSAAATSVGHAVTAVAHAHTTHSDGGATTAELRDAVTRAGADVLLLTDHDSIGAQLAGEGGYGAGSSGTRGALVVVGHEVSPKGAGHLLTFATTGVARKHGRTEAEILDAIERDGGFAYPAHPFSEGSAMSLRIAPPHAWRTFEHPAVRGLEVWSLATDTAEAWRTPLAAVRDVALPRRAALAGPPERNLRRWDELCVELDRPLGALGGIDAHAGGVRVRGRLVTPLPHARWLGLVQTQLWLREPLTGDEARDEARVLEALRAGRSAVAVPPLGDPRGAAVWWESGDGSVVPPGGEGPSEGATLRVEAPPGTLVSRFVDGEPAGPPEPVGDGRWPAWFRGIHRVELWREDPRGRPRRWLLPSPVRLTQREFEAARR